MGGFIPALGGLRGIAAISVFFSHLAYYNFLPPVPFYGAGAVGVMMFFALSGYLMTTLYLPRKASADAVAEFARARFARVYPLYALTVLVSGLTVASGIGVVLYELSPRDVWRHLLLLDGKNVYWTITVEFQFYAVFATFWLAARGYKNLDNRTIAALLLAAFVVLWATGAPGGSHSIIRNGQCFLVGMLVAFAPRNERIGRWLLPIMLATIPVLWTVVLMTWGTRPEPAFRSVGLIVFAGVLLWAAASAPSDSRALGMISSKPMLAFGEWSYGIYLIHNPIIWLGGRLADKMGVDHVWLTPFVFAAVLIVARRSYLSFEVPMRILLKGRRSGVAAAKV